MAALDPRTRLAAIGQETVEITRRGEYLAPTGSPVSIAAAVARAVAGTRLYTPADLEGRGALGSPAPADTPMVVTVTDETTAAAARRLSATTPVAALNFASAKKPGGGFLSGARAQEEDLARCSALHETLLTQPAYYDANKATRSPLYTDHLIYSPEVPFFRDDQLALLPAPFLVSILTSPAPNAGEADRSGQRAQVRSTLERRAEQVLRVAAHQGQRVVVLGAWGCGVFRNDPHEVADVFARLLATPPLDRAFTEIVFAIYDRTPEHSTRKAFEGRFG